MLRGRRSSTPWRLGRNSFRPKSEDVPCILRLLISAHGPKFRERLDLGASTASGTGPDESGVTLFMAQGGEVRINIGRHVPAQRGAVAGIYFKNQRATIDHLIVETSGSLVVENFQDSRKEI
jgi:hypothetical protein